jgi:hypothetical protein
MDSFHSSPCFFSSSLFSRDRSSSARLCGQVRDVIADISELPVRERVRFALGPLVEEARRTRNTRPRSRLSDLYLYFQRTEPAAAPAYAHREQNRRL